ncbi:MAG: DUF5132 domain-containing protein [Desulfomonilaceae bacterium]
MAVSDMMPKGTLWTGIAVGAGLLIAPVVVPAVASAIRPLFKVVIKGGFMLYEKGREMVAEVAEVTEDLIEEAKAEVHADLAQAHEVKESL